MIVSRERVMDAYWRRFNGDKAAAIEATAADLCIAPEVVAEAVVFDEHEFAVALGVHLETLQEA